MIYLQRCLPKKAPLRLGKISSSRRAMHPTASKQVVQGASVGITSVISRPTGQSLSTDSPTRRQLCACREWETRDGQRSASTD